jgi:threonine/homoserine/homoserine lactone efflux protein
MDLILIAKSLSAGFLLGAVVGPIGMLCIQRSLSDGFMAGFATGVGAALAESTYGAIAVFGISAISETLNQYEGYFKVIGGAYLLWLAYKSWYQQPKDATKSSQVKKRDLPTMMASTFVLTITNPVTILLFLGVFTSFDILDADFTYSDATLSIISFFIGSMMWWSMLSTIASSLRKRLTYQRLRQINQVSGIILAIFGIVSLYQFIF